MDQTTNSFTVQIVNNGPNYINWRLVVHYREDLQVYENTFKRDILMHAVYNLTSGSNYSVTVQTMVPGFESGEAVTLVVTSKFEKFLHEIDIIIDKV